MNKIYRPAFLDAPPVMIRLPPEPFMVAIVTFMNTDYFWHVPLLSCAYLSLKKFTQLVHLCPMPSLGKAKFTIPCTFFGKRSFPAIRAKPLISLMFYPVFLTCFHDGNIILKNKSLVNVLFS